MKIIHSILRGKHVIGVVAHTEQETTTYYAMLFRQDDKGIHTENFYGGLSSIKEVKEKLGTKYPVSLVASGANVLTKQIDVADPQEIVSNLHRAFPGIDLEAFYFQLCFADQQRACPISLARKTEVQEMLETWKENGFSLANFHIGSFPMPCLAEKIREMIGESEKPEQLSEQMEVNLLLAGAIYFQPQLMEKLATNMDFKTDLTKEHRYKRKIRATLIAGLSVLLAALLANTCFFNHYTAELTVLESELARKQGKLNTLEKLKQEVIEKENLLLSIGGGDPSQSSFYADRIAGCLPEGIQLESMMIAPLSKSKTAGKEDFLFDRKKIQVQGISENSFLLNELIARLKEKEWIGKVEVNNYSALAGNKGKFEVTIQIA